MDRVFIFLYGADMNTFVKLMPNPNEPIICADSGILLAKKLEWTPRNLTLIGDLDSVPKQAIKWCRNNNFNILKHPMNKNLTDGHLALEYACKNYPKNTKKIVIGGLSSQLDHTLGNILPAIPFIRKGHKIDIFDKRQIIHLSSTNVKLVGCKNHVISLVSIENTSVRKTKGLKWKLSNEIINPYQSRTLRNIAINNIVEINISSGLLMVIESW